MVIEIPRRRLRKSDLLIPPEYLDRFLKQMQWGFKGLSDGRYSLSLQQTESYLINRDPVLWAERSLLEKASVVGGGGLNWRLFDYQKVSARYRGNTIHQCGSETGKTREIVLLSLWMDIVYGVDGLTAAPQDGNLLEIYDLMLYQLQNVPHLSARVDWKRSGVKPYRRLVYRAGNERRFKPAGDRGAQFRNVHVNHAVFDEAAVPTNPVIWGEFFRACLPGCEVRIYSVPDGNQASEYSRIKRLATPAEEYLKDHPEAIDPLLTPLPNSAEVIAHEEAQPEFLKFRWSKPMMPAPHWTPARRRKYIAQFGGEDSPLYKRNVLGEDGERSNSVFPRAKFEPLCGFLHDYVHVVLRLESGRVLMTVHELNPEYQPNGTEPDKFTLVENERWNLNTNWREALRPWLTKPTGRTFAGVDVGWTTDPTEIVINRITSKGHRWFTRVTLKGFDDSLKQMRILCAIDRLIRPTEGWGLDATGAGGHLENSLRAEADPWHDFDERVSGFVMQSLTAERELPNGREMKDAETGKIRKISYKELGTRLLERGMHAKTLEYPADRDVLIEFTSHAATPRANGQRSFGKTHDHLVEAQRVAELRLFLFQDQGVVTVEPVRRRRSRKRDVESGGGAVV